MSGGSFNWHEFLGRWREEWVPREGEGGDEGGGRTIAPLGRPGADEAAIAAAEERLGRRLPSSYREFLAVSDGLSKLLLSPASAASSSGRAVVVWRDPRRSSPGDHPAAFHLPVAEQGQELYAFTVRGTETQRSGAIPEALDPARLFHSEDTELGSELRVLQALHTGLGLSLPRFALTQGRLCTFTTRSWTRAPRTGEGFGYACVGSPRPRL